MCLALTGVVAGVGRTLQQAPAHKKLLFLLLSLDTEKMDVSDLGPEIKKGGDYPQAWSRTFGNGRSLYTSLGHRDDIWSTDPVFRAHITGGIRWALGIEN